MPDCVGYIWEWFKQLTVKRSCGAASINPISEEALGWFFYTRRLRPRQWELDALSAIDTEYLLSTSPE